MRKSVAVALVAALSLPCLAATPHRVPGLWEISTSMQFKQGGIQIPPEVRQQMEARGMRVPDITGPHTFKHCLTPEEAARDEQPRFSNDESCKTTKLSWSGASFHAEFNCSGNGAPSHGEVDGTISEGGKAYSGTFNIEGNNSSMGGHYVMQGTSTGKWLGATCGADAG